ncbi:MAG: ABC transporter permease [Mycoplasmataceae bacterium]|nr:ABC transporter permease [Mycoplasmataceae bacterium]
MFKTLKTSDIFNSKFLLMLPFLIIALILIIVPTIIIIVYAFIPHYGLGEAANWKVMTLTTWQIIGWTLLTSFITTLLCIVIGFPFAYFLSSYQNKVFKAFALLVITSPIWSSTLFKLIGLKTMFDILNGAINSTYGDQYTILGYVYIFLPLMILPIYQILDGMPKNYKLASLDLGASKLKTFFLIILPYAKNGLISGITLVFIPSMMIISVTAYLNNASNSQLLGGEIYSQGSLGLDNKLSLSRASIISIVSALILLILWFLIVKIPKWVRISIKHYQIKYSGSNYYKYSYNLDSHNEKKRFINKKISRHTIYFYDEETNYILSSIIKIKVVKDYIKENNYIEHETNYETVAVRTLVVPEMVSEIIDKSDVSLKE